MNMDRKMEVERKVPVRKALLVTHVSGFLPQFEMNNVRILQEMGYEVHYASNFHTPEVPLMRRIVWCTVRCVI